LEALISTETNNPPLQLNYTRNIGKSALAGVFSLMSVTAMSKLAFIEKNITEASALFPKTSARFTVYFAKQNVLGRSSPNIAG
jgi:hypothetical protein